MATMEKPKVKTKKSKNKQKPEEHVDWKSEQEEAKEHETAIGLTGATKEKIATAVDAKLKTQLTLDFDQFAAVSTKEIVSHACSIADSCLEHEEIPIIQKSPGDVAEPSTTSHEKSTVEEPQLPTAPPVNVNSSTATTILPALTFPPNLTQYPDLAPLQHVETKSKVVYQPQKVASPKYCFSNSHLMPFTAEQLKQLYHCAELDLVKQFELDFLMNSLLEQHEHDPLYQALSEYYSLQSKLTMNLYDVEKARTEVTAAQQNIWIEIPVTKEFSALCGDKVFVKETYTYNVAQVDGKNLESTSAALNHLFNLVCNTYTTNLITAKITAVKIDQIINDIISPSCLVALAQTEHITLQKSLDPSVIPYIANLRRSISILFHFMRKLSPNTDFANNLKAWLKKLISLHLLIATKEDHWFLLFNILRCPSGVGSWATEFLQIPCKPKENTQSGAREIPMELNSPEMNHCIATLQILLLPIKKRNDYLKSHVQSQKEISDPAREERWILIDSDGEDSHTENGECVGLKESDFIALVNQIPFEKLFLSALNIEKFLNDYIISPDLISANQVLRVIAFLSKLIEIFGEGMLTYNTERYKQLAKRLGRLIRHTLQYSSDYYELFMNNDILKDPKTCERISVELNALLFKACNYIYRCRNLATWQYFSSLPFHSLDAEITWQIFYYLNVGFPLELPSVDQDYNELLKAPDFWKKFNVANADSSAEDLYYLLQAFFEIANERDRTKDWEIIKTICLHIFNIGFLNDYTREICYKTARDMLVNLTLSYEDLMTCILLQLKIKIRETENISYLIKSLPLENWKPDLDSFEILSNWLLHFDFKSEENMLARLVISHLNWGFDCDGRLFLPHNIHVRMACLVSEALTKHAPEVIGLSGISESVRQVSSLIDFAQSTKEHFTRWCWTMVSLLRLHFMDLSVESVKRALQNPTEPLMFVPELERIELIYQGVTENRPLAVYVAVLVSLHGHSIPLICQKGLDLLKLLLNDYRHAAVIRCIELIMPLFIETPETLANCESFHFILNSLLNADKTYLKMAKDMLYPNCIGPVLELLDNMIHYQITSYTNYGLSTPLNLINVWLDCLTSLPNWPNTNVTYLLDNILRVAYQFPDARFQAVEFFHNYYKDCDEWKGLTKISTLKTFFSTSHSRIPAISPQSCWLAMVLLEIEFKTQEAYFWPEFLRQLSKLNGKAALETALKQAASVVKMPVFSPQMLVIYKYATLIAGMDISHPLFPIINQKFFELFLSRVPLECDEYSFGGVYGVSDKFYDFNVPLMKKISTHLKAAETNYLNESTKRAAEETLSYFYSSCAKLMKTYDLWLHNTTINRHSKDDCNFPPQFNNQKLREILNGNTAHWTEYLYLPNIRREQKYQAEQWAQKCYRSKSIKHLRSPLQPKEKTTPIDRIKRHLSSYDKQLEPPIYVDPYVKNAIVISKTTLKELKEKLKVLNSTATKFHFEASELNSLNRNYLEIILNLYEMVPYEAISTKSCNSLLFNRQCSSPARIVAKLQQVRKTDYVEERIQKYQERHDKLIESMLTLNVDDFARSIEEINGIMRLLIVSYECTNANVAIDTGIQFYYTVVDNLTDITRKFHPTNDLYTQILNELSILMHNNQIKEGPNILLTVLKRPELNKVLSAAFVPCRTPPEMFIKMYKLLVESYLKRCDTKILFVLLSKFDLPTWLQSFNPKLQDIHQLLELVLRGLECWSQPDSSLLQDQFRRHLVHIFNFDFPQHYGEVMQMVLDRISEQKLMPNVLLDLLNSLLSRFNCSSLNLFTSNEDVLEISSDFARRQNLFNLKAITDTVLLFARHFQKERLNHGLHGLYPKHKDYCTPLAMWFSCFGHMIVVTAICTYQEMLADQISDVIFGSIIEMYSPWLVVYNEETLQQSSAKWIRQLTVQDKVLLPWSEQYSSSCKLMIKPFIETLTFLLENLPASSIILSHTFGWYAHHFTIPKIEYFVYLPIHEALSMLPWERFKPHAAQIDMFYDNLEKFIPAAHAMLGHIFIRIDWNLWFSETFGTIQSIHQPQVVSRLFVTFIKMPYEPNIHINIKTSKILEDAINYPWYMVGYTELEGLFKWYINTLDPSIVLKIPNETNYADRAVLDLLRLCCGMMPQQPVFWEQISQPIYYATAKRILYTRTIVQLLRLTATKHAKLLDTKEGLNAFSAAFTELLTAMNSVINATATIKTIEEQNREALNLMVEIIVPMQTQSVETSNLFIDAIIRWQAQCRPGNFLLYNTLVAIGHMKTMIAGVYPLLESTIAHYFRTSPESTHLPSWAALLQTVQPTMNKLQLMPIIHGPFYFTLHIFIIDKMRNIPNMGDKITFLQDISQLVESLKTNPYTEPRLALVWGVIITRGCEILCETQLARKPLLMLANYLAVSSKQTEGWGDSLLGAIGFKNDVITNRRKALARCLACVIHSLFPHTSSAGARPTDDFEQSIYELTLLLAHKKFADIKPLIVKAIGTIKDESTPALRDVPLLIYRLISIFYENSFLATVSDFWDLDARLV